MLKEWTECRAGIGIGDGGSGGGDGGGAWVSALILVGFPLMSTVGDSSHDSRPLLPNPLFEGIPKSLPQSVPPCEPKNKVVVVMMGLKTASQIS